MQLKLEAKVVALTTQLARAVRPKLSPPKDKSAFLVGSEIGMHTILQVIP